MEDRSSELRELLGNLLIAGSIAGLIAAGINVTYMYLYESMSGYSYREEVNFMSVAIASFVPGVFAGLGLFMLFRFSVHRAIKLFIGLMILIGILSIFYPLVGVPGGVTENHTSDFMLLTIPMHIIATIIYIVMLVRSVRSV